MEKFKAEKLEKFGEHIRKLRNEQNLSQDMVVLNSERLIKATISDIENGKRNLSFTTLLDLAKGLGKHPRELLDFDL
ncbi:helix-turn-helix domain-containing protein [Flavobacterium sp. UGB4466]|uniref:helix-turn-helix domain-containing protein n=1 Tax=Flavobacterium sp. UGB4466 TaxID=2730889 RepID=UPI00192C14A9|nr:helix-turn-helix transcriptional regulator [Flavobacterium sp. UGB4466]